MSESSEKPRDFLPVDLPESVKLLREAAKTLGSAILWTKDQDQLLNTHVSMFSESGKVLYTWVPQDYDPKKFTASIAQKGSDICYFSISLPTANIFFKTKFVSSDPAGLKFEQPTQIYKVQRRKNMRMPVPEGYVIKIEFPDPLFPTEIAVKKALDISAGGLAFIVKDGEEVQYYSGLEIKGVTFTIRNKKIVANAVVRHSAYLPPNSRTPGVKVGIEFQGLPEKDAQVIASYVFEESRKYFSRFI